LTVTSRQSDASPNRGFIPVKAVCQGDKGRDGAIEGILKPLIELGREAIVDDINERLGQRIRLLKIRMSMS
jgi:hypothetical protein